MIPIDHFLTINQYDSVREALKLMRESFHQESAWQGPQVLIVVDNHQKPVGLLTLKCLLKSSQLKQLQESTYFKSECVSWHYINKCQKSGIAVRELMRPIHCFFFDYHHFDIITAAAVFTRNGINYIPVLKNHELIGIINKSKLFYELQFLNTTSPKSLRAFDSLSRNLKDIKSSMSMLFAGIFPSDIRKLDKRLPKF
ncbi:CBS domain-containing protein [Desulfosporosinus orientis]|nr:CBS domain-containing protein [Desulfosporosinus orientis]